MASFIIMSKKHGPIEAAKLYNHAAVNYIGEFAHLNTIQHVSH